MQRYKLRQGKLRSDDDGEWVPYVEAKRLREIVSSVPCCKCGGEVVEFTAKNDVWNRLVRRGGSSTDQEYLCVACFAAIVCGEVERLQSYERAITEMADTYLPEKRRTGLVHDRIQWLGEEVERLQKQVRRWQLRQRIGWYSPGTKRFCYSDVKDAYPASHESYSVPVFIEAAEAGGK